MAKYIPSTAAWVREQVELYEGSGGTAGTTLRDTGLPVIIVTNLGNRTGAIRKTPLMRVGHSVLFELGLLVVLAPVIAWYLGVTLWQAVVMDVAFAGFFLVYAFVFTWAYDVVFPVRSQPVGDRPNTSSMSN